MRALDRFDRRRPFGPWLHRIVANRSIDWARARAARAEVELGEPPAADVDGRPEPGNAVRDRGRAARAFARSTAP